MFEDDIWKSNQENAFNLDFQCNFIYYTIQKVLEKFVRRIDYICFEKLEKWCSSFVSNHRDIVLDTTYLMSLFEHGLVMTASAIEII
jgi:hypothetical protein